MVLPRRGGTRLMGRESTSFIASAVSSTSWSSATLKSSRSSTSLRRIAGSPPSVLSGQRSAVSGQRQRSRGVAPAADEDDPVQAVDLLQAHLHLLLLGR